MLVYLGYFIIYYLNQGYLPICISASPVIWLDLFLLLSYTQSDQKWPSRILSPSSPLYPWKLKPIIVFIYNDVWFYKMETPEKSQIAQPQF